MRLGFCPTLCQETGGQLKIECAFQNKPEESPCCEACIRNNRDMIFSVLEEGGNSLGNDNEMTPWDSVSSEGDSTSPPSSDDIPSSVQGDDEGWRNNNDDGESFFDESGC